MSPGCSSDAGCFFVPAANTSATVTPFSANFLFVNATPDAPSLSFFVNNDKIGADAGSSASYAQASYTAVALTSPGFAGAVTANTNIKAKATSGSIGGVTKCTGHGSPRKKP